MLGKNASKLTGKLNQISVQNRKWLYVSKAVNSAPGQFHDRHVQDSNFVKGVLTKIWENYKQLEKDRIANEKCGQCKKRKKEIKKLGIPTPFGLVSRLNKVSAKFMTLLNGSSWKLNVYTSKWGSAPDVASWRIRWFVVQPCGYEGNVSKEVSDGRQTDTARIHRRRRRAIEYD